MRTLLFFALGALLGLTACSGQSSVGTPTSTTGPEVATPLRFVDEWVKADLKPEGILIGDTLAVAGDRFVIFEEIDGNRLAVWSSEDGQFWSNGDVSAFPGGEHVLWTHGNEWGAVAVGWSGGPAWPPSPESPPVLDRVWTTRDGLTWTPGRFEPDLPASSDYLKWFAEVTAGLPTEEGFLLVGQVRWFVDGQAMAVDLGLDGEEIVAYPTLDDGGACRLEGIRRTGESAFSVPCADFGIDPGADALFETRPPVLALGSGDGSWEVLETVGLETVSVVEVGVGPEGVSLFTGPTYDLPRFWTSVDLRSWQMVERIPGIEADAVFSMLNWRDGWVADIGYEDVEGGELWWTRLGSAWEKVDHNGPHGEFAVGGFGLLAVTNPADASDSVQLYFTPDGQVSRAFDVSELFGTDTVADGLGVGSDSVVAVISTFDESADYPWIPELWTGLPGGE